MDIAVITVIAVVVALMLGIIYGIYRGMPVSYTHLTLPTN